MKNNTVDGPSLSVKQDNQILKLYQLNIALEPLYVYKVSADNRDR